MKRIRGMLLRKKPYMISPNGGTGMKISLNEITGLEIGDKVYQEVMTCGIVLLIPEKIYEKEKKELEKIEMEEEDE